MTRSFPRCQRRADTWRTAALPGGGDVRTQRGHLRGDPLQYRAGGQRPLWSLWRRCHPPVE
eukprot:335000-Prorocentrum_minimum.AAC.3